MQTTHEGKWCWGPFDGESYEGDFDHEWQAHDAARDYAGNSAEPFTYEVAQKTHPLNLVTDNQIDRGIELMLEQIDQSCFDEVGGDDQILELPNDDGNVLIEYVRTFLLERAKVSRWGVKNVKQHTVIAGVSTPVVGGA
jgi:hypothetical protein